MLTPTNLLCRGRRPQRPENVGSVLCCLLRNTPPTTTVIARSHPKVTTWQSVSAFVSDRSYQEIATGLKDPRNDKTSLVVPNFTERQDRMKKDCCILQQSHRLYLVHGIEPGRPAEVTPLPAAPRRLLEVTVQQTLF